jgi:hypothetical protein
MCNTVKIIGLILLLMGIGMLVGLIIPCNTLLLAVVLIAVGLVILKL